MTKRNLTLFIIILAVIVAVVLGYLFLSNRNEPAETTEGTNFLAQFSPFGKSTQAPAVVTPPADISGYVPPVTPEAPRVNLVKVSSMPIAGFVIFMKERFKDMPIIVPVEIPTEQTISTTPITTNTTKTTKGKTALKPKPTAPLTEFVPAVRYVARATGNIYQSFAEKTEERKFSTTVIPKVYEAYFGNKGESVIMRYLKEDNKTIASFTGALPKEILGGDTMGNNEVKGSFLPENVTDLSMAPDTLKVFYLFNIGDGSVGITANSLGDKKSQVFDSPFTEWLSQWPNSKMITLTTKPSASVPGYMYAIDPDKKDFNKILGGINGLTTLTSPSGKLVLYSNNTLALNIHNTDTKSSFLVGLKTLPEKCTWGKTSEVIYCAVPKFINRVEYPDVWYQGEISFSDEIWKIDPKTGSSTMISDPISVQGGEDMDGIKLALDENENYLFFVNKKDSYLWKLELK